MSKTDVMDSARTTTAKSSPREDRIVEEPVAAEDRRPYAPAEATTGDSQLGVRKIVVNEGPLPVLVDQAWEAVRAAESDLSLFRHDGALVHVVERGGAPRIERVDPIWLNAHLARCASWVSSAGDAESPTGPPASVARDMIACPAEAVPELDGVLMSAAFDPDGRLIAARGYDADARLFCSPPDVVRPEDVPERPTAQQVADARDLLLNELLGDFPLADGADVAHAIGAIVLPVVRQVVDGCTPVHVIESPTAGSGKTLLADTISIIGTGRPAKRVPLPTSDAAVRRIVSEAHAAGTRVVLMDNVDTRRTLDVPALCAALTSPNDLVWLITANNPAFSVEMARRCVCVRLVPDDEQPWRRTNFAHPRLIAWLMENRVQVVEAVCVLVQAWMAADRPVYDKATLGSFEHWSEVIGGILQVAQIPAFLGNVAEQYHAADDGLDAWRAFITAWHDECEGAELSVGELDELCQGHDLLTEVRDSGSDRSRQTRLGLALKQVRDRVFGAFRVTVVEPITRHHGVTQYKLVHVDRPANGNGD